MARFKGFALAILLCCIAIPLAVQFNIPSSCFLLVAMASSLFGGRKPGWLAVIVLALAFDYLFLPSKFSLLIWVDSIVRFVSFVGAMLLATELIDSRRRFDLARLQREMEFRALADTCPDCIVIVNMDQVIEFANPSVSRIFGYSIDEVIGRPSSFLLPGMGRGQHPSGEFSARRKSAENFYVEATCGSFEQKTTIFLRDITDRKQVQRELEMNEANLRHTQARLAQATQLATASELAASIVHEISQPVAAMVANGQACLRWLSMTPPKDGNARASVERIVRDGRDATEIIRGLRNLFKRSPPEKTLVDLGQMMGEVVALVRGRAERHGVAINLQVPEDLPKIPADRVQLQQVLFNLVSNAVESMHSVSDRSKRLEIRSRRQDDSILIEVEDQGIGIADFEKIFETFFTTKEEGMGIGLSICRSIVEAHRGRLWAAPGAPFGTVFSFTIPLNEVSLVQP